MPTLATDGEWRHADWLLLAASAAGLCVVAYLLAADPGRAPAPDRQGVGLARLEFAAMARRRPAGTLAWEDVRAGELLFERDSLFVAPTGSATVRFLAGAKLDVEERSLVVFEPPEPARPQNLDLIQGWLSGAPGQAPLEVNRSRGSVRLQPGAAGRIAAQGEGTAGVELLAGRAEAGGAEVRVTTSPVHLRLPDRNEVLHQSLQKPSVTLSWDATAAQGWTLQVARDRNFASLVASAPGGAGSFSFAPSASGAYFWRVLKPGVAGGPLARSEIRKFLVVDDVTPIPYLPRAGEVVLAPPGQTIPFWWTAVDGASRYQLEIAAEPSFQKPVLRVDASGPSLWTRLDLPEGSYYWRVRVDDPERGPSPPSDPSPFRLVLTPVLGAPELMDPSLEVHRGTVH